MELEEEVEERSEQDSLASVVDVIVTGDTAVGCTDAASQVVADRLAESIETVLEASEGSL